MLTGLDRTFRPPAPPLPSAKLLLSLQRGLTCVTPLALLSEEGNEAANPQGEPVGPSAGPQPTLAQLTRKHLGAWVVIALQHLNGLMSRHRSQLDNVRQLVGHSASSCMAQIMESEVEHVRTHSPTLECSFHRLGGNWEDDAYVRPWQRC
jgi:hypothetical protein